VSVTYEDVRVLVEVDDSGRAGADGNGATHGLGTGITGMRERVLALGGDFSAGPTGDGGFRVRASLPAPVET
jgi:signal transduction histidine kinase